MKELENFELLNVEGGSISGSVLNYFNALVKSIFSFGQHLGGALRRISKGNLCPL